MGFQVFTQNGTFTPLPNITTYNFVVIGGGGQYGFPGQNLDVYGYGCGLGGGGTIVITTYTNITNAIYITIGEPGQTFSCGGGLTQVYGTNVQIIAAGGGGGGGINGGFYGPLPAGNGGSNGANGSNGGNGMGGSGALGGIAPGKNGGSGGNAQENGNSSGIGGDFNPTGTGGNGGDGGSPNGGGGGGGGTGINGIIGKGGRFNSNNTGGGGGVGEGGGGGGAGYAGGGGGGSGYPTSGLNYGAGGGGGSGSSIALYNATNTTYASAPDTRYGNYGAGGILTKDETFPGQPGYVLISWNEPNPQPICNANPCPPPVYSKPSTSFGGNTNMPTYLSTKAFKYSQLVSLPWRARGSGTVVFISNTAANNYIQPPRNKF